MRKKILIVDDDADILELLTVILEESGYEVRTLSCGDTVFESIDDYNPNLVLMDVMLADMDGREICKSVKQHDLNYLFPIILISGTHDLAELLGEEGAPNDFIEKPFNIDFLLQKVEKHLSA